LAASVASTFGAKVPISASVSTTPRTRSSVNSRSMASPIGCSTSSSHSRSSPRARRASDRVSSGSVTVGNTDSANRPVPS
jgi:hypothetical protein